MDIDDEFQDYMRHGHPDVPEDSAQHVITRLAFFAGMMTIYEILHSGADVRDRSDMLVDVRNQLLLHFERSKQGMERGFTNTTFEG